MGIFRRKKKNRIDTSEYPDDNVLKIDELFGTPHSEENKTENISGVAKPDIVQERVDSEKNIAGNPSLRKQYVENCCSQMVEAEKRIDEVKQEYHMVNAYITDVQIIDSLPKQQKIILENLAKRIIVFNNDREECGKSMGKLTGRQYSYISGNEDEIKEVINKLTEDEAYCQAVRTDMRYLEGEKLGLRLEQKDLNRRINSMARVAKISFTFFAALLFAIWVYYYYTNEDITYMIYVAVGAGIVFVAVIFGIHQRSLRDMKYVEVRLNKAITMLNKLKLKYVNVASRLEYMYEKYDIKSSRQLIKTWNAYVGEENKKKVYAKTSQKLLEAEESLVTQLKSLGIRDAEVWISQTDAIVDKGEMKKLKSKLEKRREKVKATLDYNMDVLEKSKTAIKDFMNNNKKYAREIADIVDSYNED